MISLNYFLLVKCFLISFITHTISVKTYQVRRVNESTYLVTSFPELDYENYKNVVTGNVLSPKNKETTLSDDKRSPFPSTLSFFYSTVSTVSVGDSKNRSKLKIPASVINKARDNYFRHFYATMKKSNISLFPQKFNHQYMTLPETDVGEKNPVSSVNNNLLTARKLASLLITEVQISRGINDKLREMRTKRRLYTKRHRSH